MASGDGTGGPAPLPAASGAGAEVALPPEGVDWANRWAELENATAYLEAERVRLSKDNDELRGRLAEQAAAAFATSAQAAVVDSKELQEIRAELDTVRRQAEARLGEVVAERDRNAKLSEELQRKAADLATLSHEKLELQYERNEAKAALLPEREARERLQRDHEEVVRQLESSRVELQGLTESRDKLVRERADLRRKLEEEAQQAKEQAAFQQQVSDASKELQQSARLQALEAEEKLKARTEDFAAERAVLENKLDLKSEQLARTTELSDSVKEKLAEVIKERDAALEAQAAATKEFDAITEKFAALEEEKRRLEGEHEALLVRRVPGSESGVPENFPSLTELVREATTAREEALQERQAKEQLQELLQDVEREVRQRYPALLSQKDEVERLRHVAKQLTTQNEGLLSRLRELEISQRDSESRAKRAERSEQILEAHARDIAKQLALLVHENRKLNGYLPSGPGGTPATEVEAAEQDRKALRTVEDLAQQNEALRKSVARLTHECDTHAQKELQTMREERDKQMTEWEEHLAKKAEEMKALVETIERLHNERDDALRQVKQLKAESRPSGSSAGQAGQAADAGPSQAGNSNAALRDQLSTVREEFTKCTEHLHKELKELRTSELSARQELASVKGRLDFELGRKGDLETTIKEADMKLDGQKLKVRQLEDKSRALEDKRSQAEEKTKDLEAAAGQARRDKATLEMQVRVEKTKVQTLEQDNAALLAEKAAHGQAMVDMQARFLQESETYKDMKAELQAAYHREESGLREQLEISQKRQEDLKRTTEELGAARVARETEACEAKAKAEALQTANQKLEAQLARSLQEVDTLRAEGATRPRRGADVAADAAAQLERSAQQTAAGLSEPSEAGPRVSQLERQLRFAEEKAKEHAKAKELWDKLIKDAEAGKLAAKEEAAKLEKEVEGLSKEVEGLNVQREQAKAEAAGVHIQLLDLRRGNAELQNQLEKKDAEVATARLEAEQKAQEANSRLKAAESVKAGAQNDVQDWEERHRQLILAHSKDITALNETQDRYKALEKDHRELRAKSESLAGEVERARAERLDEVENLQKRLESAEQHAKALSAETKKYQDHLLALTGPGGPKEETSEDNQRLHAEMKRARELGELRRQEVELDRARSERENKALRTEKAELQARLDEEQRKVNELSTEVKRDQRAMLKLANVGIIEDENRSLKVELRSLEDKMQTIGKELDGQKQKTEPFELELQQLRRKDENADRLKQELDAKVDEWKRLHDELVQKFDAEKVREFKKLQEESAKHSASLKEKAEQVEKANAERDKAKQEIKQGQAVKAQAEELQKSLSELQTKFSEKESEYKQLAETSRKSQGDITRLNGLKELRDKRIGELEKQLDESKAAGSKLQTEAKSKSDKRIGELEKELDMLKEERKKLQAEAGKAAPANAAVLKKMEEEVKQTSERADKALSLCSDYQRALEALLDENRSLERFKEEQEVENREREKREKQAQEREARAKEVRDKEAREREAQEARAREAREAREKEDREREAQEARAREAREKEAREREASEREAKSRAGAAVAGAAVNPSGVSTGAAAGVSTGAASGAGVSTGAAGVSTGAASGAGGASGSDGSGAPPPAASGSAPAVPPPAPSTEPGEALKRKAAPEVVTASSPSASTLAEPVASSGGASISAATAAAEGERPAKVARAAATEPAAKKAPTAIGAAARASHISSPAVAGSAPAAVATGSAAATKGAAVTSAAAAPSTASAPAAPAKRARVSETASGSAAPGTATATAAATAAATAGASTGSATSTSAAAMPSAPGTGTVTKVVAAAPATGSGTATGTATVTKGSEATAPPAAPKPPTAAAAATAATTASASGTSQAPPMGARGSVAEVNLVDSDEEEPARAAGPTETPAEPK